MSEAKSAERCRDILRVLTVACGRSVDQLLEQVADGHADELDSHQADCVHCQAALSELNSLWSPVVEFAKQPVQAPLGLVDDVMDRIYTLAQDVWYTLQLSDIGAVKIAARVVGRLARDTARTVPGVRAALGRTSQGRIVQLVEAATRRHRHPHAAVGVLGRTAVVDIAVAVRYGEDVHEVAAEVQQRVIARLRHDVGLQLVNVNVTVDDVVI